MAKKFELDENADLNSIKAQVERMRVGTEQVRVGNDTARVTINRPPVLGTRTKAVFTGVLAAVLVVLVVALAYALLRRPPVTTHKVPNVVGMKTADAKKQLLGLDLKVKVTYRPSSQKPAGTVESSNPAAGTALRDGEQVTLTVSGKAPAGTEPKPGPRPGTNPGPGPGSDPGPRVNPTPDPTPSPRPGPTPTPMPADDKVALPDVVEMTASKARRSLEALGLKVVETAGSDATQADKIVLGCDPKAGEKVARGSIVHLTVNARPEGGRTAAGLVSLKNYAGTRAQVAVQELTALGLTPSLKPIVSQNQPSGFVIETEPPAGSQLPRGARVAVVVAQ
jgi:beta-lactam-binding protein with PASTA domain